MARSLSANIQTEVVAKNLSPILILKGAFDSGDLNLWTGVGSLTFNSETYTGAGNFLSVTPIIESVNIEANGVNFILSGIPSSYISTALSADYQGRMASMWFGCLNSSGALIADPYLLFKGRMDVLEIFEAGETSNLTLRCENLLIDFRRKKTRRYTDEDQKSVYPTDDGLEFVDQLQDREIVWGRSSPS